MNSNVHFVSDFNARELHQGGVEDDPLGVSDLGDGLCHDVILCFTEGNCQPGNKSEVRKKIKKSERINVGQLANLRRASVGDDRLRTCRHR